jgi:hypothetical protein
MRMQTMAKRKKRRYSTIDERVAWMLRNQWIWWHRLQWKIRMPCGADSWKAWHASNKMICKAMSKAGLMSPTTQTSQGIDELVRRAMDIINN